MDRSERVLFLDIAPDGVFEHARRRLGDEHRLVRVETEDPAEIEALAQGATSILVGHIPATAEIFEAAAPTLRFVQRLGRGLDLVDLGAARRLGVEVAIVAGGNAPQVAEHVVMLMLAWLRQLDVALPTLRSGGWAREEFRSSLRGLADSRVAIVGMGQVGRAVVRLLDAFGTEVIAIRRDHRGRIARDALEAAIEDADIISLHVPMLPETRHLVDAALLERFRRDALLVNTSRGSVVDERALTDALLRGSLGGAALDVFEDEPLPAGSPLRSIPRVILTPHVAGASEQTRLRVIDRGVDNILRRAREADLPDGDWVLGPNPPARAVTAPDRKEPS